MADMGFRSTEKLLSTLPCVVYECTPTFEVTYLSDKIYDLIGIPGKRLVGNHALWENNLFPDDAAKWCEAMEACRQSGHASLVHRLVDVAGLPVWVCNRMQSVPLKRREVVRGCILMMDLDERIHRVDPGICSSMAHKLANQFQIMGMILSGLKRSAPELREMEALESTFDKAVEVAEIFSHFSQVPLRASGLRVADVMDAALSTVGAVMATKSITLKTELTPSLDQTLITGDKLLLESAIGYVLQDAMEATAIGGEVVVTASTRQEGRHIGMVLRVVDSTGGKEVVEDAHVAEPYSPDKKASDSLPMRLVRRIIEMHAGSLRVIRTAEKGREVEIALPAYWQ